VDEDLDRQSAAGVALLGLVDLAHPSSAEEALDSIRAELLAGR
jgi:hypothetical protein